MTAAWAGHLQGLRKHVYFGKCTPLLRRQIVKKHMPLNSYISLYEESETNKNGTKLPLIDLIEPDRENDPEALYFGREYTEAFIERLKENLSPMEEQVLYLHLTGTDYKKIAELLKKSPKSIDNALQRIKKKTEKMLKTEIRA